jgi:XTP/dITP diphosphohydrolase
MIVFASNNQGKIRELDSLFVGSKHQISTVNNVDIKAIEVEENGSTFAENAALKALAYSQKYSIPALADDSGLEVQALNGAPGVASNRWFEGSDNDRNNALLDLLRNQENRSAKFTTVACLHYPETRNLHFFKGVVPGIIAKSPSGNKGFGYDPIFIPSGYDQTFANLGSEIKNRLSHRARAFEQVKQFLDDYDKK